MIGFIEKKSLTYILVILITLIAIPAEVFADDTVANAAAAQSFSPGETAYIECDENMIQVGTDSDGKPDYLFYHQAVKIISTDATSDRVTVESNGRQLNVSSGYLTRSISYKADTQLRQTIINKALSYNRGVAKTCYAYSDGVRYSGEYTPKEAAGFDCLLFTRTMIEGVLTSQIPPYDLPRTPADFQSAMNSNGYLYNEGYPNSFRMKKISRNEARPGDVILFDVTRSGTATHVAIYLGGGDFIECTNKGVPLNVKNGSYTRVNKYGGVFISRLDNLTSDQIVGYVRVIPDTITPANMTVYANKDCNIRTDKNSDASVVKKIKKGEALTLKYTTRKGAWAYVTSGNAAGYISMQYISPVLLDPTVIKSVKGGKKSMTVKWKRKASVDGYDIQYSLKKKFSKPTTVTVNKKTASKKKIKNLKSRKKYYVRVRTYKTVNGIKCYSAWSKKKQAKTR